MKKEEIGEIRKNINRLRMMNVLEGFAVGLSAFGLVAGSALGITGATLYAVGQTRVNDVVNTYIASQEFQDEKATMQEQAKEATNTLSELEKFYKQGYISKDEYKRIKKEMEHGFNDQSDYQLAKRIIDNNDDNQFHAILKKHERLTDAGIGLLVPSAVIYIFKGAIGLSEGLCEGEWGICGTLAIDNITDHALNIRDNNLDILSDKVRIQNLKKEEREATESEEENEEE